MFKKHVLSPILVQELFKTLKTPSVNTVYHGTECVSFLGPQIKEILSVSFKKIDNIDTFKKAVKT